MHEARTGKGVHLEWRTACGFIAAALCVIAMACGSSGGSSSSSTPEETRQPAASATSAPAGSPTPVDYGVAAEILTTALLQPADVAPDFHVAQQSNRVLQRQDVPGLGSPAKGAFLILASPDKNEFVNQLAVVPDDGNVSALLDAFDAANYVAGLTAAAKDATATAQPIPDAPPGAKGLIYSGTQNASAGSQPVKGEAVAFTHGRVFVVVIHGAFQTPKYAVNAGALASMIDSRLNALAGAN